MKKKYFNNILLMLLSLSSYDINTISKLPNKTRENFLKNLNIDF